MTSQMVDKLLTHMFALCLRVDDYATDIEEIREDLNLPINRYVFDPAWNRRF